MGKSRFLQTTVSYKEAEEIINIFMENSGIRNHCQIRCQGECCLSHGCKVHCKKQPISCSAFICDRLAGVFPLPIKSLLLSAQHSIEFDVNSNLHWGVAYNPETRKKEENLQLRFKLSVLAPFVSEGIANEVRSYLIRANNFMKTCTSCRT